jgi:large subunit ribosomal protein L21
MPIYQSQGTMYAVIETGGKQYRVELGAEIEVERLDVEAGQSVDLGRVLLVADGDATQIGRPVVDGARVTADVVRQDRADKVVVFKYKPKARRRVKKGHRQDITVLRISEIALGDRSAAADAREVAAEQEAARKAAQEEAAKKAAADQALAAKLAAEKAPAKEPAKRSSTKASGTSTKAAAPKSQAATTDKKPGRSTASRTQAGDPDAQKTPRTRAPRKSPPTKDE